jgi:hypothetical protein
VAKIVDASNVVRLPSNEQQRAEPFVGEIGTVLSGELANRHVSWTGADWHLLPLPGRSGYVHDALIEIAGDEVRLRLGRHGQPFVKLGPDASRDVIAAVAHRSVLPGLMVNATADGRVQLVVGLSGEVIVSPEVAGTFAAQIFDAAARALGRR